MKTVLSPETTHVGDTWEDTEEVIIAYGYYTDECQAVVTLIPRRHRTSGFVDGGPVTGPRNYATFFVDVDGNVGSRYDMQHHSNIVNAIGRYANEMGMDT